MIVLTRDTLFVLSFLWLLCQNPAALSEDTAGGPPDRFARPESSLHGIARPKSAATLRFLVAGTIAKVHVTEGQWVREGEPLVSLDDRLAKARLRLAELSANRTGELEHAAVQLKYGEKQLSRLESLHTRNAVSALEVEEQRALVERGRAVYQTQLEAIALAKGNQDFAEEQLRHMTVFAPFDGMVTQLHEQVGVAVDPNLPIVAIANLEVLQVELYTPVRLYGELGPGDSVELRGGAPVNRTIQAQIESTSPIINAASGTFRCLLRIDNVKGDLPAGFSVSLLMPRATKGR